ncbi:MAG: DUF3795 domain-containing protein [Chloroflexi bacterium]|nr:DUF3795 domain-containing protein [Chloroflexota bacterium]
MDRIVAYCGLVCSECPAYIATQADDLAMKERVVAQWRVQFNAPDMDIGRGDVRRLHDRRRPVGRVLPVL